MICPEEGANPFGKALQQENLLSSLLNVTLSSPSDNPRFHSIFTYQTTFFLLLFLFLPSSQNSLLVAACVC